MNFRRKAHPIPLPERQFDIAQLGILQHGIQIGQGNFRPILLRGGEVKAHCRPGATQPGSFKHGPVPKPNLRHPTTHVLLIVEQEAELLQIAIRPSASSLAWTSGARVKLRARVSRAALKSVPSLGTRVCDMLEKTCHSGPAPRRLGRSQYARMYPTQAENSQGNTCARRNRGNCSRADTRPAITQTAGSWQPQPQRSKLTREIFLCVLSWTRCSRAAKSDARRARNAPRPQRQSAWTKMQWLLGSFTEHATWHWPG